MKQLSFFWTLVFVLVTGTITAQDSDIKALIVDGQNNHNWRGTTPVLKKYLTDTGLFTVQVATTTQDTSGFSPDFAKFDVVVLNYNGKDWPEETQQNFTNYVRNGGGVVVYHAANNSFTAGFIALTTSLYTIPFL